jgi:hypothetical protein
MRPSPSTTSSDEDDILLPSLEEPFSASFDERDDLQQLIDSNVT